MDYLGNVQCKAEQSRRKRLD